MQIYGKNNHEIQTYVVGAGSSLFKSINFSFDYIEISGRQENLELIPHIPENSRVIIFSDPPTVDATISMMLAILAKLIHLKKTSLIFISSVSADFLNSDEFPYESYYSLKKRTAESILIGSDLQRMAILRLGNVYDYGAWREIREKCSIAIMPRGPFESAITVPRDVESAIQIFTESGGAGGVINCFAVEKIDNIFSRVVRVPLLLSFYNNSILRIFVKVIAKILKRSGIYIPSPEDINAFLYSSRKE